MLSMLHSLNETNHYISNVWWNDSNCWLKTKNVIKESKKNKIFCCSLQNRCGFEDIRKEHNRLRNLHNNASTNI